MRETSLELEPQLETRLPQSTEDPTENHQRTQIQAETLFLESPPDVTHQVKPQWTRQRKLLLLILGFSLCAAFLGIMIYIYMRNIQTVIPCLSLACQQASTRLSASTDPFKAPCDYFLTTCGAQRFTPESTGRQGPSQTRSGRSGSEMKGQNRGSKGPDRKTALLQYFREILESNDRDSSSAVEKTKTFYRTCLDTRAIDTAGAEPFLRVIEKLGGWAVSGHWERPDFNATLGLLMKKYATFPFFNVYVGIDPSEVTSGMPNVSIQIDQPDLLIPTEWTQKAQMLRSFLATYQRYLILLGATPSGGMIHVGTFMSVLSEFALAVKPPKGQSQRMSIEELQRQAPAIDWLGCLQATFYPLRLVKEDQVLLHNLPYMVHMSPIIGKWLKKHELTNIDPLQTYMVLNLLNTLMPAMDSRFTETAKNLSVALDKTDRMSPRWQRCIVEMERGFDPVLTHLLSDQAAHREAEEIIQNVFSAFKSQLRKLKWTNQTARQTVMKRVQSLIPRLWTTSENSSEADLDQLFSTVSVSSHNFFSNYLQLLSLWQMRRSKRLSEQTNPPDILSVTPLLLGNKLLFPMGMFVPPFFHPTYPRAMNYGEVGFLIAKDVLHLLLPDIYSQTETVHTVGKCVWTHYVTATGSRAGAVSLSAAQQQELWVQYSALQIALQAYHQTLKTRPEDTSISGLSHTHLFLSSFSQVNCDPHHEPMPLEPSFLITVLCATPHLCPSSLQCPSKTLHRPLKTC